MRPEKAATLQRVPEASPRVRNPWGQGERLRAEILRAAARLLSELDGEQGLTIRGVARAAGISPASIYQHFSDKSALVQGLIAYIYAQLAAAMAEADAQHPPEAILDRIRARMKAYCLFALENPGHYRLIIKLRPTPARRTGPLADIVQSIIDLLERGEREGIRMRVPPSRAAVIVFVGVHGRVALQHTSGGDDQDEQIMSFVDELISLVVD